MPIDAPTMDVLRKNAIAMAMLWFTARDYNHEGGQAWFHVRAADLGLRPDVLPGRIRVTIEAEAEADVDVDASDLRSAAHALVWSTPPDPRMAKLLREARRERSDGVLADAPRLAPHLPKVMDEAVLERAKTLYANSPGAYRGTRPLPWQEAPLATRQEFIEKAKAEAAAGVMACERKGKPCAEILPDKRCFGCPANGVKACGKCHGEGRVNGEAVCRRCDGTGLDKHDPWCVGGEQDGICNCGADGVAIPQTPKENDRG